MRETNETMVPNGRMIWRIQTAQSASSALQKSMSAQKQKCIQNVRLMPNRDERTRDENVEGRCQKMPLPKEKQKLGACFFFSREFLTFTKRRTAVE